MVWVWRPWGQWGVLGLLEEVPEYGSGGKGLWHHHDSLLQWVLLYLEWECQPPGSWSLCRRVLPQPLGCLCSSGPSWRRPSPWWQVAVRASPALGGGSSWHWCVPEASSSHILAQLQMQLCHVFLLLLVGGVHLGLAHTPPSTLVLPHPESLGWWTLEGSWWKGAWRPFLWPCHFVACRGTFLGAVLTPSFPIGRVPTPNVMQLSNLSSYKYSWPQRTHFATLLSNLPSEHLVSLVHPKQQNCHI